MTAAGISERVVRVAFQGERGAFGDEAIRRRWCGAAEGVPARTFADVASLVEQGRTDFGLLPVWNSTIGLIHSGCDLLRQQTLHANPPTLRVVGDVSVVVRHQLLALPGVSLRGIRHVASHPTALAQCGRFFAAHPEFSSHAAYDTAGSALQLAALASREWALADDEPPWYAALGSVVPCELAVIASQAAGARYGLTVLAADVQDVPDNVTHFLIVANTRDARDEREAVRW